MSGTLKVTLQLTVFFFFLRISQLASLWTMFIRYEILDITSWLFHPGLHDLTCVTIVPRLILLLMHVRSSAWDSQKPPRKFLPCDWLKICENLWYDTFKCSQLHQWLNHMVLTSQKPIANPDLGRMPLYEHTWTKKIRQTWQYCCFLFQPISVSQCKTCSNDIN